MWPPFRDPCFPLFLAGLNRRAKILWRRVRRRARGYAYACRGMAKQVARACASAVCALLLPSSRGRRARAAWLRAAAASEDALPDAALARYERPAHRRHRRPTAARRRQRSSCSHRSRRRRAASLRAARLPSWRALQTQALRTNPRQRSRRQRAAITTQSHRTSSPLMLVLPTSSARASASLARSEEACQSASLRPWRPVRLFSTDQIMSFFSRAAQQQARHRTRVSTLRRAHWQASMPELTSQRIRRTVQVAPAAGQALVRVRV